MKPSPKPSPKPSRDVALVVGGGPGQAFMLGTLVAVADIRLAAEELAHEPAVDNSTTGMECSVSVDSWVATVTLSATATPPDRGGYRWRALGAITDSLGVSDGNEVISKGRTEIRFSRRPVEGTPTVSEPHLPIDRPRRASGRRRGIGIAARQFPATGLASG